MADLIPDGILPDQQTIDEAADPTRSVWEKQAIWAGAIPGLIAIAIAIGVDIMGYETIATVLEVIGITTTGGGLKVAHGQVYSQKTFEERQAHVVAQAAAQAAAFRQKEMDDAAARWERTIDPAEFAITHGNQYEEPVDWSGDLMPSIDDYTGEGEDWSDEELAGE